MNRRRTAVLAVALIAAGCSHEPEPVAVAAETAPLQQDRTTVQIPPDVQQQSGIETAKVAERRVAETLRSPARLVNDENRTWRVGSIAEGRIVRVFVSPGDRVKQNQVLAQLHSHEVHESRALYKTAKADLARAKGVVEFQKRQRDRAKRLLDLKAGSVSQLEERETGLRNAQTEVDNAITELERTRTHLEEVLGIPAEESSAPSTGQEEDDDLIPVRAPASGIVLARNVTPGTVVNPASDLFLISDLGNLWAMAEVNEEYLGQLHVGMPVRVFVQAYEDEAFVGRIGKLGDLLDPDTRTVQVRVDLTNPNNRLKPEMYATAEIEVGSDRSAIVIPSEAVQDLRGQPTVFLKASDDAFEIRPVTLGRSINGSYEVSDGLRPGESIAVQSTFILKSEFLRASMEQD